MPLAASLASLVAAMRARVLDRGACGPLADRRVAAAARRELAGHLLRVAQYSAKRLVLCIIRICIILCINTDNTWTSTSMYSCTYATRGANGCHFQGGEADCPAHAGRAAGHAAGPGRAAGRAAGRPIRGSAAGQQAGRSVMFCPRCWRVVGVHTVHSARRWCCIISIQISAPGIVYYTHFYYL